MRNSFLAIARSMLTLLFATWVSSSLAQEPVQEIRIGIIGLDTSHCIAFTKLLNDKNAPAPRKACRVVCAYPHGSADIESSVSRIPKYTREIQELGVTIVGSIDQLIENVDAVLLETNDGRPHLEQVLPVLKANKPVFVDKPIAGSLVDAIAIFQAAKKYETPLFSSSSLRFAKPAIAARKGELVGDVLGCSTFGPAIQEPTHPDLYWYGIHGVEQLFTVMGPGCVSVSRVHTEGTDVVVGLWQDGRVGTFRGTRTGPSSFGGTVFGTKGQLSSGGNPGYNQLIDEIASFFQTRTVPVESRETIEIYAFMSAADDSRENAGQSVSISDTIEQASRLASERLKQLGID